MKKEIEVEFIGKLSKEKFEKLKELFTRKGEFKGEKNRLSFMYFREKIPRDIKEIKNEKVDLRFRITNKKPEIVLKYGTFNASHSRKEISILINPSDCEKYLEFLSLLGWNIGVIYATKTYVYNFKGIEFSLVEIKDFGYNFEAEILSSKKDIEKSKKRIIALLKKLNLKPFDEKGLNKQCNKINNKKELQFDFNKQSLNEIKTRFKEFF